MSVTIVAVKGGVEQRGVTVTISVSGGRGSTVLTILEVTLLF